MSRARWLTAPALALAVGCAGIESRPTLLPDAPVIARGQEADAAKANPWTAAPPPAAAPSSPPPTLAVTLDSVLQLAEQQNPQMALARERVNQAFAEKDLAEKRWLPEINVGSGYYRHEGGIQDQTGVLVRSSMGAVIAGTDLSARIDPRAAAFAKLDAARRTWQQKGELRRVTSEVLLDAAGTYVDLLASYSGLAIARSLGGDLRALRDRAQKLAVY